MTDGKLENGFDMSMMDAAMFMTKHRVGDLLLSMMV